MEKRNEGDSNIKELMWYLCLPKVTEKGISLNTDTGYLHRYHMAIVTKSLILN